MNFGCRVDMHRLDGTIGHSQNGQDGGRTAQQLLHAVAACRAAAPSVGNLLISTKIMLPSLVRVTIVGSHAASTIRPCWLLLTTVNKPRYCKRECNLRVIFAPPTSAGSFLRERSFGSKNESSESRLSMRPIRNRWSPFTSTRTYHSVKCPVCSHAGQR